MDETEFYRSINKEYFDRGIKALTSDTMSNLVKLLMLTGNNNIGDYRGRITMAMKKLVDSMLEETRGAFKDTDDFIETGRIPDYMDGVDRDVLNKIRDLVREKKGYPE